jgi:hypothetical protein
VYTNLASVSFRRINVLEVVTSLKYKNNVNSTQELFSCLTAVRLRLRFKTVQNTQRDLYSFRKIQFFLI